MLTRGFRSNPALREKRASTIKQHFAIAIMFVPLTPEQFRTQGHINMPHFVKPILMTSTPTSELEPPRFETLKPMLFAGLVERYDCQSPAGIPNQWQRFAPFLGNIPRQVGKIAYGVIYNFDGDGHFDYLCGVEVAAAGDLPKGITSLPVPAQKYAVFTHRGHIAGIRATISAIWSKWLPESGHESVNAPSFERYGPEFDPQTGLGGFEIWVPVEA
jgi:AraC family transcriptional regulator